MRDGGSGRQGPSLVSASPTVSVTPTSSYNTVKHWFAFGDSYTATGFNPSLAQPSDENPIGNPDYPGNTICGPVPTWVDYAATKYNTSIKFVYNFASIGATINGSLVPVLPWVVPLVAQTEFFASAYADGPWTSDDAIFSIWIGINDISNSYNESGSRTAFNDQLLDAYFEQTDKLIDIGARRFAFFNVPPFDRSPLLLARPPSSQSTARMIIEDYNSKLQQRVAAFARSAPVVDAWFIDIKSLVNALLDAPQRSGFTDATSFGAAGNVVWCDDFHLAPAVHDLIAASVQNALDKPGTMLSPVDSLQPKD
ncbi:hypothetical protein AURDEDRAFT_199608 [Auricularia subglabra TFB-10046 SS5]|nr:hypothetical protein AURDEDRAFT_199608 [Auricularia subglabra TFB-10046 SS5]